jgi:hypothetical protein
MGFIVKTKSSRVGNASMVQGYDSNNRASSEQAAGDERCAAKMTHGPETTSSMGLVI